MTNKEKIILGIASLLVIGGVALGASGTLSFGEKPQVILNKMVDARMSTTSEHIDLKIQGTVDAHDRGAMNFNLASSGVLSNLSTTPALDFHTVFQISQAGMETPMVIEGDLRSLEKVAYLRVSQMPAVPFLKADTLINKWFSIDPVSIYKKFGNGEDATRLESVLSNSHVMPKEFYTEAYGLAVQEGLVSSILGKGSEKISGVVSDKYEFRINPEKLPTFIPKYVVVYNKYAALQGLDPITAPKTSDMDINTLKNMQVGPVAVWIGKADSLPYKITGSASITSTDDQDKAVASSISFEAVMSDYNKPVTIEKPAGATPIENLFQSLMGGALSQVH
jgi:hypothetical protein